MKKWIINKLAPLIKFQYESKWNDDLIWCPSQCEKRIKYNGRLYTIYLRWRWDDPWTADLIETDASCDLFSKEKWIELNVGYFRDSELEQLKKKAISETKKELLKIKFNPKH